MIIIGVVVVVVALGGVVLLRKPTAEVETNKTAVAQIDIANMAFAPSSLTVKAGSMVQVTNKDIPGHSVTNDDGNGKAFDTGIIANGASAGFVAPTNPGTYTYHCVAHPSMKGSLIVE